ncbi:hypothetical protein BS329_36635 [Amycolatopsis coloradensis]|uniref:Allene oxide cyclase barrel-like domain-containing protein n=1 Tax=Amycolatopsis coloradensis TaxID=76021 RepID=A0A1R0KFU6_9PSEU|nr:hypothetical protein [Amycolatopsis coloradensis]OLZ44373.1 hypothetical protein BS329_36635 [Amycolatopsis coloradensis]
MTGIRHIALIAAMVATLALVQQGPAHAGTELSQRLCQNNQIGTLRDTNLTMINGQPVSYGYRDSTIIGPGVPLQDGDVVRIRAGGSIKIDSWPWGPSYSPAGHPTERMRTFWGGISAPSFGLYGFFNSTGTAFPIGGDSGCVIYRGPQTWLWLPQNDDRTVDNSGRWDITVRIWTF